MVQTLVILPIVVAGVVFMVKNSLALAFSLGGIVAAVSFRNTLRDTKDAVYIFLATGVGLAAGIQSVPFAAALSITYNIVILILWYTDFGRSPADLQGPPAARRLERALALSNRTSAFVSLVDDQILKSLDARPARCAVRAGAAPARSLAGRAGGARSSRRSSARLELRVTGRGRRRAARGRDRAGGVGQALGVRARRPGRNGEHRLHYRVRLKKSVPGDGLVQSLRTGGAPHVIGVELADGASMSDLIDRLRGELRDRYVLEREVGSGRYGRRSTWRATASSAGKSPSRS